MLKIVINSNYDSSGTKVCIDDLWPRLTAAGHRVMRNDWNHYDQYDLVLFMSPDADIFRARKQNQKICIGIMNPMIDYPDLQRNARAADFLVVGSVEQRDVELRYNQEIFIYYMFPDIPSIPKTHIEKTPTVIGYHGNKEHLINLYPRVTSALEMLGAGRPIEFWAVYNIKKLGRWTRHLPCNVKVRHIQWTADVYERKLAQVDVGIVNNILPGGRSWRHIIAQPLTRYAKFETYPYRALDTLIRFKYATNAGRIYPFVQLGIPVVSDFVPSAGQLIRDSHSGLIVNSTEGWFWALKQLVEQPSLRQLFSDNLRGFIREQTGIEKNFAALNNYFIEMCKRKRNHND